ncbi:MAG: hypothetical protein QNJ19_15205 [Woeseiaceae bacterium]|nr:hypothetical protein [Woeseiaceae bacterium]
MRSPAVVALLLIAALAGIFLFAVDSSDRPRPEHAQYSADVDNPDTAEDNEAQVPKTTSPETEVVEPSETGEDCTQIYLKQMARLGTEVLTDVFANQVLEEARSRWAESNNLELRIFAAQLLDEYDEGVKLFARAMEQPTSSPYFLWSAVNMCLENLENGRCPIEDWLDRLLAVDSENSLVWIRAAGYYHSTGDLQRAKAALDQAVIAYEANDYWTENIMNAKAGIDVVGGFSESVSYVLAIEVAPVYPSPRALYEKMCKEMAVKDPEWAVSCASYGEHVGKIATRAKVRRNAKSLQADVLIATGEPEDSAQIMALRESPTPYRDDEIFRYPDSVMLFVSLLESDGEIRALERLRAEHEKRRRDGFKPACGDVTQN